MTDPVREEARAKLARDIAKFRKEGGKIEKLGHTPIRHYGVGDHIRLTADAKRARLKASASRGGKAGRNGMEKSNDERD